MKTKINKLEKSEIEIESVIDSEKFASYEDKALKRIGARVEIPGFRTGHAPNDMIKKNANPIMLLEEMAELAIHDAYPQILEENKIDAIGQPQVQITKIAEGNDLEFKIRTAVLPEMKLPDYKKIAKDEIKKAGDITVEVKDEDIEKVLKDLQKMRAHEGMHKHEGDDADEHNHPEITDDMLPELNDEFAKSFGDFANLDALKSKITENVKMEKEVEAKDKRRLAIIESIIADTKCDLPELLVNAEIDKLFYKLEADIQNVGFKMEDYLKQIGKSVEDLRKEWYGEAEKRAKLQMILYTISKDEGLKPTEEEVKKEAEAITKMYKDADPIRAEAYVDQMLTNEKVFNFLEEQK